MDVEALVERAVAGIMVTNHTYWRAQEQGSGYTYWRLCSGLGGHIANIAVFQVLLELEYVQKEMSCWGLQKGKYMTVYNHLGGNRLGIKWCWYAQAYRSNFQKTQVLRPNLSLWICSCRTIFLIWPVTWGFEDEKTSSIYIQLFLQTWKLLQHDLYCQGFGRKSHLWHHASWDMARWLNSFYCRKIFFYELREEGEIIVLEIWKKRSIALVYELVRRLLLLHTL